MTKLKEMDNLFISIEWSENEQGFMYEIYLNKSTEDIENGDSDDGGCCTGSPEDALEMATVQTQELIKRNGSNS